MQETPHSNIPDDEIDFGSFLKKTNSFFVSQWRLLAANVKTVLVFFLAAILLSVVFRYGLSKTYKSSFIIRPGDSHEHFHLKLLKDIQDLLKTQDYATLAEELKSSQETISALAGLDAINPTLKASPDSVNYTEITITTTDYNQFIPIQNSLLNYLENNPFFLKMKTLQSSQVVLALDEVNKDLPRLDSLKNLQLKNYAVQQSSQNTLLMNELVDPTSVYKMAIDRLSKKSNLVAQQTFPNNFNLIKSCVVVKHANWPPRLLALFLFMIPACLLLCLIFLNIKAPARQR